MKTKLLSVIAAASIAVTSFAALTITASAKADYVKVTSNDDLVSGDYLIVYEDWGYAFDGSLETLDAADNKIDVAINGDTIESSDEIDAAVFTIDVDEGTIKSASGLYIYQSSYKNSLLTSPSVPTQKNTFSIEDGGNAVISIDVSGNTVLLKFNPSDGQIRFRYYKDTSPVAEDIALYKRSDEASSAATATYAQVGEDYDAQFVGDGTASLWKVTVTPGTDTIETLSVKVNEKTPDAPLSDTTQFSGKSEIVFGVVLNGIATDVQTFTALVNGEEVTTTLE